MFNYDFENENYNVRQAVEDARANPEVALWFINQLSDFELTKIFTQAWCKAMEKQEVIERLAEIPEVYVVPSEEIASAMEKKEKGEKK